MSGPALAMAEGRGTALTVFLVAAEESGDRLGAALMRALAVRTRGAVRCVPASVAPTWRQKDCRPCPREAIRFHRDWRLNPAPAGPHPRDTRDRAMPSWPSSRTYSSSSTARISPTASRASCVRAIRQYRSWIMSALGLGVAAGPGAGDARLYRSCAGAAAVRASGLAELGGPRLHLCRPSADRGDRSAAAECRGGRAPARRPAACAGAARKPRR